MLDNSTTFFNLLYLLKPSSVFTWGLSEISIFPGTLFPKILFSQPSSSVKCFGIFTDCKPEHLENAYPPIDVTLSGIVIDCKLEQPENALYPIDVTLSGIVIDCKPEQPENAYHPIDVTPSGIVIDCKLEHL